MPRKQVILVVDDESRIRQVCRLYLEHGGYRVIEAENGGQAMERFREDTPDLIVLDLMLPGIDGLEICRRLRSFGEIPILMLTARGETSDKLAGFGVGADDYMVKPFDPQELVARVAAILKRAGGATCPEAKPLERLEAPGLILENESRRACLGDKWVELAPKEFDLLSYLLLNKNMLLSREQILNSVWGRNFFGDARVVDVYVKHLRQKLPPPPDGSWFIRTVWGAGYRFEVKQENA